MAVDDVLANTKGQFSVANASFTTLEDIGNEIEINGRRFVSFEVDNTGSEALTDFQLHGKPHASADYHVLVSAATSPTWGTSLATLAGGAKDAASVDVSAYQRIKFMASAAVATAITVRGGVHGI